MSEVDALFRLLSDAPPRSAQIVKRYALAGASLETLARSFAISPAKVGTLVARALMDVESGGSLKVADAEEVAVVAALFSEEPARHPLAGRLHQLVRRLQASAEPLRQRLDEEARAFEESPDRARDEWLRRLAIAVIIALAAYFYWREASKPPKWERRPVFPSAPAR
jgi:hypothetical protein